MSLNEVLNVRWLSEAARQIASQPILESVRSYVSYYS